MKDKKDLKRTILIAEDDPVSCRVLEAFLIKWGYEVVVARDGNEALSILEAHGAPRLAILDWMMPGLEGPQVCQRLRSDPDRPYTYLLLLTARNQKEDILRGLESGADDYLTKPFDAQELRARLHVGQRVLDLQDNLINAREDLRFRATHDHLTTIPNRGVILDVLSREHSRQLREGGTFGIALVDLDHFKYVNDMYGHLCGDAVLKEAAHRINNALRPYDMVGRYGGEEFLIVASAADLRGMQAVAERIRKTMESTPFVTDAGPIHITASIGIAASIDPLEVDAQALLRLADDALYRAKEGGRNRTEVGEPRPQLNPSGPAVEHTAPVKSDSD
jgi:two-component system, cell cycle response regulator